MRKFLMGLLALGVTTGITTLGGAAVGVSGAHAAPVAGPVPVLSPALQAQPVQYYEDWRHREWRRREAYERWQRHEARRHWQYEHGRPYGYGPGGHGPRYGYYDGDRPRW